VGHTAPSNRVESRAPERISRLDRIILIMAVLSLVAALFE
jgi:hypothetical protein